MKIDTPVKQTLSISFCRYLRHRCNSSRFRLICALLRVELRAIQISMLLRVKIEGLDAIGTGSDMRIEHQRDDRAVGSDDLVGCVHLLDALLVINRGASLGDVLVNLGVAVAGAVIATEGIGVEQRVQEVVHMG